MNRLRYDRARNRSRACPLRPVQNKNTGETPALQEDRAENPTVGTGFKPVLRQRWGTSVDKNPVEWAPRPFIVGDEGQDAHPTASASFTGGTCLCC